MALASERIALVRPGETLEHAGHAWRLASVADVTGPNWVAREAVIEVGRDGRAVTVLRPQRRTYPVQRTTTTEASISTNGLRDLYAVLGEEREGAAVLRLHHNPLAPWIWIGAAIMALGGALSLADRRLRVGAPMPRRMVPVPAE
jgi:cytochrome c-type biogenesis protein CcmF